MRSMGIRFGIGEQTHGSLVMWKFAGDIRAMKIMNEKSFRHSDVSIAECVMSY